jgi:hypothetical protein
MHKAIAKQLDLDERQTRQLKMALEEASWLYSSSMPKRMATVVGYWLFSYITFLLVTTGVLILIPYITLLLQELS